MLIRVKLDHLRNVLDLCYSRIGSHYVLLPIFKSPYGLPDSRCCGRLNFWVQFFGPCLYILSITLLWLQCVSLCLDFVFGLVTCFHVRVHDARKEFGMCLKIQYTGIYFSNTMKITCPLNLLIQGK